MAKLGSRIHDYLQVAGQPISAAVAGTTNPINVLIRDGNGDIFLSTGTEVPSDTTSGYAKGALHVDTNVAAATTGLYVNIGTTTSSDFDAITDA